MAEVIGIASGMASLVVLVAQVTRLSYNFVSDIRTAPRVQKQYLQEISALADVLLRAEEAARDAETRPDAASRPSSLSEDVIADCVAELDSLRRELDKHARKFLWVLKEGELRKHIDRLQRFRSIFSDFISAHTLATTTAIHHQMSKLSVHHDRQVLLDWVKNAEETSKAPPVPFPGTGRWFLESEAYRDWRSGRTVLWCHGAPGVGKSGIAAVVLDDLSESLRIDSACAVSYFCDFATRKQQTNTCIMQSLVEQMIMVGGEDVADAIGKFVEKTKSSRAPSFRELLGAFVAACEAQETYLILDGVDEMENTRDIVALLGPIIESKCRVLVTSRDIPDVRGVLGNALEVEMHANKDDLTTFVEGRFEDSDVGDLICGGHPLNREIADKASGVFLLAKILVDQLVDLTTIKQMRQALQSFPSRLEDAFESSLQRINALSKSRSTLAYRVIGWITHTERRLTSAELIQGLALEEGDEDVDEDNVTTLDTILKACVGLVVSNKEDNTVGMVHATAYRWFHNRESTSCHEDIAGACLLILNSRSMAVGPCPNADEMAKRILKMPFLAYAARYWGTHVQSENVERKFNAMIKTLLECPERRAASFQALHYRYDLREIAISNALLESIPRGHQALHLAAFWNLKLTVAELLASGAEPSTGDSQGWTPLHWACFNKSWEVISPLLSAGANPDATDSVGFTPLFWVAFHGSTEATQSLLDHGGSHLVRDIHGWTALKWATSRHQAGVARLLLKHHETSVLAFASKPKVALKDMTVQKAIQYSKQQDMLGDIAASLPVDSLTGSDYQELSDILQSPEMNLADLDKLWATGHFDPPVGNVWRTMNKAERINGLDSYLEKPRWQPERESSGHWKARLLHTAIRDDNILAARLLIEMGADVKTQQMRTRMPLHAAAFRRDPAFVRLLLKHGADPSVLDSKRQTPLQQAVVNGFEATVEALIRGGVDVNAMYEGDIGGFDVDYHGDGDFAGRKTALMLACGLYAPKADEMDSGLPCRIIRLLLAEGADFAIRDMHGMTVAHYAAQTRNYDLIGALLEAGADFEAVDDFGRNTVHHYCLGRVHRYAGFEPSKKEMVRSLDLLVKHAGSDALSKAAEWKYAVKQGRSFSVVQPCVHTPISLTLDKGDWELFEYLRDMGAEMQTTCRLDALLDQAISAQQPAAVRFLVDHGATILTDSNCFHDFFNTYSWRKSPDVDPAKMELILDTVAPLGLDVNIFDWHRKSILHKAASSTDSEALVLMLLRAGADPYKPDGKGIDPFIHASINAKYAVLHTLLTSTSSAAQPDHWTQFLDLSAVPQGVEALPLICKAIVTASTPSTINTILCASIEADGVLMVQTLLSLGADPNHLDPKTETPALHLAARAGNASLIETLVAHGADVDAADAKGRRALHVAAWNARPAAVKQLLALLSDKSSNSNSNSSSSLDAPDVDGWRPLHYAAWQGDGESVAALMEAGADAAAATATWSGIREADSCRPSGMGAGTVWKGTALHLGAMAGSKEVVGMLLGWKGKGKDGGGVDVDALAYERNKGEGAGLWTPGSGPTALRIALDTGTFYSRRGLALDEERLAIAEMLVERGARVDGVADHLKLQDVLRFEGREGLWERLRRGIVVD